MQRRTFLEKLEASLTASPVSAWIAQRGSGAVPPEPPPSTDVTTFQLVNNETTVTTLGYKRVGLPFKYNDVPSGSRIKIQRNGIDVAAQFDNRASWSNNSLQFCTACLRDTPFAVSESRTYSVVVESGAFVNTNALSLSSALSGTDFNVNFTSIIGSTNGSVANLTASLNTHAAVSTRVTLYESGPVSKSWMIWGMAGGHAHLKTIWYVTVWVDGSNNIVAREICAVVSQDWWAVAGKEKLTYNATFTNGATTLATFNNVEHVYSMQWATVRMDNDLQHGARHWVGATRPNLLYKPNRTYWIASSLVPPFDITAPRTMRAYINTYTPGSSHSHRPDIDSVSAYMGRGWLPNADSLAFCTQTAADARIIRVNNLTGLSIPIHRRTERTRTRTGETADIANTVNPVIIYDERGGGTPSSYYTFTSDGLPTPVHAYMDPRTPTINKAGWVDPTGGTNTGTSFWGKLLDHTHAVPYSYYNYLYEGERYLLEANIDLAMNMVQGQVGGAEGGLSPNLWWEVYTNVALYPGATSTQWAGIALRFGYNERGVAWSALVLGSLILVPDNDVHKNFARTIVSTNAKWLNRSTAVIPADVPGSWVMGVNFATPWHTVLISSVCYLLYDRTKDINWISTAEFTLKGPLQWVKYGNYVLHSNTYRCFQRPDQAKQSNFTDNYWNAKWYESYLPASIDPATNRITESHWTPFTTADTLILNTLTESGNFGTLPPELQLGKEYYVVNPTSNTSFQISASVNGPPITFGAIYTNVCFGYRMAGAGMTPVANSIEADSYLAMQRSAVLLAKRYGTVDATDEAFNIYNNAYYAATHGRDSWASWDLSLTA